MAKRLLMVWWYRLAIFSVDSSLVVLVGIWSLLYSACDSSAVEGPILNKIFHPAARYALMRTLRLQYPLSVLCRVLEVSRSGYYAWQHRRPSKRARENARLEVAIQAAHVRTRQTYGPERLQAELREDGFPAGIGRITRLRKKLGLRCTPVRMFTTTTDSTHALPVAENVLAQTFVATRPNETWVTDITYVPTAEGWLYVAGIKDLFTCEIVGYAMGARMTTALVSQV